MNRRGTGTVFCVIAAFLFAVRYVCAAIWGSGTASWDADLFNTMMGYVGSTVTVLSIIAALIGITYLLWAERTKE
jgi:hypothetical protein